mgnify:CR=1 FL=1
MSLGLGVFGISNILKNIREASAIQEAVPPVLQGVINNNKTISNDTSKINNLDIRPFHVNFPEAELTELRRRINATRWPDRETVTDSSQGVQLATMKKLARYWATDYDWRKVEAKLNALPQFITEIDGLDIHFIHVKSPHATALPLIISHGWPTFEFWANYGEKIDEASPLEFLIEQVVTMQPPSDWRTIARPACCAARRRDREANARSRGRVDIAAILLRSDIILETDGGDVVDPPPTEADEEQWLSENGLPFLVNRYGRMVFPSNFFPALDFSVFETLDQFVATDPSQDDRNRFARLILRAWYRICLESG